MYFFHFSTRGAFPTFLEEKVSVWDEETTAGNFWQA